VAGAVVHVLPARGAHGIGPGIGGRVDREPQPAPAGARVPDPGRVPRWHSCQGFLQQRVINHVMTGDPAPGLRAVGQRRKHGRQQGEKPLVVDPPGRKRVIQGAVAAGELRLQAHPYQRRHRMIGAQDSVRELEQRVRPQRQAVIQPGPELPQPLQRPPAGDRVREHSRIRHRASRARRQQDMPGPRQGLQPGTRPWQGMKHGRFPS
jgi:hypothetical protein